MAAVLDTGTSESVIVLSSSDDEDDNNKPPTQKEAMNSLGLTNSVPKQDASTTIDCPPSTSRTITVDDVQNVSELRNPDELIEKFVSAIGERLEDKEKIMIVPRVYKLRQQCREQYIQSKEFRKLMVSTLEKIERNRKKIFVHINDLYKNMQLYRVKSTENGGPTSEGTEPKDRNERYIAKLEKALEKCHRKIKELNREELSLDEMDSSESAYVYEDRLKRKVCKIWKKLCELRRCSSKLKKRADKKIHYSGSRYPELNTAVMEFVNSSKSFPDYTDILKTARTANESSKLGLMEPNLQVIAKEIFCDIGSELKSRREADYRELFGCYLTDDLENQTDPADSDPSLREKLDQNFKEGQTKIDTLMSEYTEKQVNMKLEPKEVTDEDLNNDLEGGADPDDEEEDRMIEEEQIEEEMFSDEDENINKLLDDPGTTIEETEEPKSTSDEENGETAKPDLGSAIELNANEDSIPERTLDVPPVNKIVTPESSSSPRSCMARLKVTPKPDLSSGSKNSPTRLTPDVCDSVVTNTQPPAKRIKTNEDSTHKNQPSKSTVVDDEDIICLD